MIDKVSLISKKDNFTQLKEELESDGFSIDLFFENSLSSLIENFQKIDQWKNHHFLILLLTE